MAVQGLWSWVNGSAFGIKEKWIEKWRDGWEDVRISVERERLPQV
jgi:hypothetical protein